MQTLFEFGLSCCKKLVACLKQENMDDADTWNCAACESSDWTAAQRFAQQHAVMLGMSDWGVTWILKLDLQFFPYNLGRVVIATGWGIAHNSPNVLWDMFPGGWFLGEVMWDRQRNHQIRAYCMWLLTIRLSPGKNVQTFPSHVTRAKRLGSWRPECDELYHNNFTYVQSSNSKLLKTP